MTKRRTYLGDARYTGNSFQTFPRSDRPYHVRGQLVGPRSLRDVVVCLTEAEARKVAHDFRTYWGNN